MTFLYLLVFINCLSAEKSSFILKTSLNKEFVLTSHDHISNNRNIITKAYKYIFGRDKQREINQKQWYYVHFLSNDVPKISKKFNIDLTSEISKNTFALYLSNDQLELISNISLVKKIDPNDKIYLDDNLIMASNKLFVITSSDYDLISSDNAYYSDIKKIKDDCYIINILQNDLNDDQFYKKKLEIVNHLSKISQIKLISTYKDPEIKNSLISGFTQKNSFNFVKNDYYGIYTSERYLNQNGLNGEDQVITIMDSPIDIYHTMFHDEKVPIEINKSMLNHRKIVYYGFNGDLNDLKSKIEDNEHGTHVAGTAAGKFACSNDKNDVSILNGNAPEAKILFAGHFNEVQPNNLITLMSEYNSTISTNSWGSVDYNPFNNFAYGYYAQNNPQSVFIFAGGNEYNYLVNNEYWLFNFSICDPAGSKNVLTVGALDNFYEYDARYANLISSKNAELQITVESLRTIFDPWIVGTIGNEPKKYDILAVDVEKGDQCETMSDEKVALLYGNFTDINWYTQCKYPRKLHLFATPDADAVKELIKIGGNVIIQTYLNIDKEKGINRASFSSTGPANHGILKPDVMAPGSRIISSKSKANCDSPHGCNVIDEVIFMDGTSMATPNVAGGMALVHQYFNSGKWIEKVNLDGSTSRALLINSCTHPYGSKKPDIWFGHGVIDLSTVLPFQNDFGVKITHQGEGDEFVGKHSVTGNGHVICKLNVQANNNKKKLQITLSYLDPVLSVESFIPISRDLDLIVISPSKRVYYGDHLDSNDTQHASTNEKVIIDEDEVEIGEYTIHVYGGIFIDSFMTDENIRQVFSVVATGPISNGYLEFEDSNECPCETCDPNKPGYCLCDDSKSVGQLCQVKVETVFDKFANVSVGPLEMKRIRFVSDKPITSFTSKSKNPGRDVSVIASRKCHLDFANYDVPGVTGKENNPKKTKIDFGSNEICVAVYNFNDIEADYFIEVSNKQDKKKVDKGLIIGVVIACVVVVVIVIILVVYFIKHPCNKKYDQTASNKNLLKEEF